MRSRITALGTLWLQRLPPSFDPGHAAARLLHEVLMALLPPRPLPWCQQLRLHLGTHATPAHNEACRRLTEALATITTEPGKPGPDDAPGDAIPLYIANAGLVLAAPYLPRLWSMLDLADTRAFVHPAAAHRAVHLTQFLVTGDADPPTPEHRLVLNKLLCGVPIAEPIAAAIDISDTEREAMLGLLTSMIQHWKILGSTSIAGLRESFLQREGRLLCNDDAWTLQVQPRAFDMLLDQIPWGYATLRFPWMKRLIHVDWR
jgi:Contractile injection system tape measure protein